jgi:GH15 family glucan-1,4-alpha-glucosidase
MPSLIEDYAVIGDLHTAALVARNGSIDWLCWPRFDSGACFAALLGTPENGRWLIAPAGPNPRILRRYRENTLILETEFVTAEGSVTLVDFMPIPDPALVGRASAVVRLVIGRRGSIRMRTELVIRFDYGANVPWVTRSDDGVLSAIAGPDMLALRTPVELRGENLTTQGEFTVAAGQTIPFVLSYGRSHLPTPDSVVPLEALDNTASFWTGWTRRHAGTGTFDEAVNRSLITLKALTYLPTGGLVAAPTTSLPEQLGGSRNWDYRFCWLRDATLTLLALMNAGYYDEAKSWRDWLLRAAAGSPSQLQIMYGVAGERRLAEWQVPWLTGYEGSLPVRIGNAAADQLQLDVFGEVMDALHQARVGGLNHSAAGWKLQTALLARLETIWQQPDEGIWEVRGGRQHFTHSKIMAWVAFDRAIKAMEAFDLPGPGERWRAIRAAIHAEVCDKGFDRKRGAFVRAYGSTALDASALLIPTVGFLPPTDPRVRSTVAAIERDLLRDGFVLRYDTEVAGDGLPPREGAFLACSFWLVDALVMLGRYDDARTLFERLLALRNDVGLLAEEFDPVAERLVGNFPQAFSHIALINSAHNLTREEKPAEQRSGHKGS